MDNNWINLNKPSTKTNSRRIFSLKYLRKFYTFLRFFKPSKTYERDMLDFIDAN